MATYNVESTKKPLVSIIVPSFNYGHYIGDTLRSVIAQTYPRWECVVVDDGSTDQTKDIVSAFSNLDPRVRYIRTDNRGPAAARNSGVRNTIGAYVHFLDADDLIDREKLARQIEFLEVRPEVDIVYGDVRFFGAVESHGPILIEGLVGVQSGRISGQGTAFLLALVQTNVFVCNAALVRRTVFDAVREFDETLTAMEDFDFWIRCAANGREFQFADITGTVAYVRLHASSSTRNFERMIVAAREMEKRVGNLLPKGVKYHNFFREELWRYEGSQAVKDIRGGRLRKGIGHLAKASAIRLDLKLCAKALLCCVLTERQIAQLRTSTWTRVVARRPNPGHPL